MKTSNFLLFLAIYGFIVGGMMLFNAGGSLENYAVQPHPHPIDQYHISILQYLGLTNIGIALLSYQLRNETSSKVIQSLLLCTAVLTIGSFLKACYDIFLLHFPSNTFFWVDMTFRLLIGLVTVYFLLNVSKKEA